MRNFIQRMSIFAPGRSSMTPHCGVNYGSIFRLRFCASYLPVRASVIRLYVKKALNTVLFQLLWWEQQGSLAPKIFVFATGRGSMTPHCGVNYGSIFRLRFCASYLPVRASVIRLYVKKALKTVLFQLLWLSHTK